MSSIRTLRTLIAIADTGSFAAAAQRVALTPAAVGVRMKKLEDELGRPLFARRNRGSAMTPEGASVVQRARRLVAEYEDMVMAREDAAQIAGSVVIGSITSTVGLLAASVLDLKARYPALDINLVHGRQPELRNRILAGEMDAAVLVETPGREDPDTQWLHLYSEPLMLVCSSQIADPQSNPHQLLRTQPFIRFDHTGSTSSKIEQILRRSRVQPRVILEMNIVTSIVELVRQNVGISIIPIPRGFDWENDGTLCLLPIPRLHFERRVGMLSSLRRPNITNIIRERLSDRLERKGG